MEIQVTDKNFEKEVLLCKGLVLLDFWAPWCGPCRMLMPAIEELAQEYKNVKIGKLNIDEDQAVAGKYGISGVPTIIFFKAGEEADRLVGFVSKEALEEKIKKYI